MEPNNSKDDTQGCEKKIPPGIAQQKTPIETPKELIGLLKELQFDSPDSKTSSSRKGVQRRLWQHEDEFINCHSPVTDPPPPTTTTSVANPPNWRDALPRDVISAILPHLSTQEFQAARLVCKEWHKILSGAAKELKPRALPPLQPPPLSTSTTPYLHSSLPLPTLFPSLISLNLKPAHTTVTDANIQQIIHLQALTKLSLEGCDDITDASMKVVAALKHLRIVNLKNCVKLTDRGMSYLCGQMEEEEEEGDREMEEEMEEEEEEEEGSIVDADTMYRNTVSTSTSTHASSSSNSRRRRRSIGSPPAPTTFVQSTVQRLSPSPVVSRRTSSHNYPHTHAGTVKCPPPIEQLDVSGCIAISEWGFNMIACSLVATLTSLTLGGCSRVATIENASLRALARCQPSSLSSSSTSTMLPPCAPGLRVLDLSGCTKVTNAGLLELTCLKSLERLMLWNCLSLTSEGLRVLEDLTNLTELSLRGCQQLSDQILEHIGHLERLEKLDLRTCERITGETGFSRLSHLKQLKYLNLRGCYGITDAGLAQLKDADLTGIEVLNLQECWQITASGLAHVSSMTALKDLNITGCRNLVCTEGLPGLGSLTQLTSLCLKNCERLRDGSLDSLTSLQCLVNLDISGCRELSGAGLAPLALLNNSLETLRMQHCIGLRGPHCLVHLATLNKLTVVHLGGCDNMVGTALRDLGSSKNSTHSSIALKSLNLEGCRNVPLLDRGVMALVACGGGSAAAADQLTYLSLAGCTALTDTGLAVLGKLEALKQLNLNECVQINGTGFSSWMKYCHGVEKKKNNNNNNNDDDIDIGKRSGSSKGLESLQLQGCIGITDQGLKAAAQLTSLRELNLKHCKHAGDDGLEAIAASLSRLTSLSLQGMAGVTDRGVCHLATMTSLKELELQFCWQFGEDSLCQLTACNQLSYLNLMYSWQGVTDAALHALVAGMPSLISLNVLGCHRLSSRAKADAAHLLEWL